MHDAQPQYVDLQVNGYAGIDFNQDDVRLEDIAKACRQMRDDGVAAALGTIITAPVDAMTRRIARLAEACDADPLVGELIVGIHIEGPGISPHEGYRGAHQPGSIQPATPELMMPMVEAGHGRVRLVTLAPENDPDFATTRRLADEGCIVSAGHTNASLDELRAAIDAGLSMVTHLGNGCLLHMHRHDNIIQRCLSLREHLTLCFIADGVHVPFFTLDNYLSLVGMDGAVVVSDAMAAAGLGPGRYRVAHWEVEIGEDLAAWAPDRSHLIGSAMTMRQAEKNLREHLGLDDASIRKLTRTNAAGLLNLD